MPFKRDSQTQAGKHLSGWGKGEAVLRVLRSTALRAFISWNASLPSMMTFSIEDTKQTWTSLKSLCIPKKLKRKQTSTNKYKRVWSPCVIQRVIDSKQSGQECWIRQQCSCGFKVVVSSVRMTGLKQPPAKKDPPPKWYPAPMVVLVLLVTVSRSQSVNGFFLIYLWWSHTERIYIRIQQQCFIPETTPLSL